VVINRPAPVIRRCARWWCCPAMGIAASAGDLEAAYFVVSPRRIASELDRGPRVSSSSSWGGAEQGSRGRRGGLEHPVVSSARDGAHWFARGGGRLLVASGVDPADAADGTDSREAFRFVYVGNDDPRLREADYAFIRAHFDEVANKLPSSWRVGVAYAFSWLCDQARKPEIEAFFKARIEAFDGGPRIYQQELEQLELCDARKRARTPGVEAFLNRQ